MKVYVENGSYRNQNVSGWFDLLEPVKKGKPGRRRNVEDGIYYLTVLVDPSRKEFSSWGLKKNKARIVVSGPNTGYKVFDDAQNLSDMVEAVPEHTTSEVESTT